MSRLPTEDQYKLLVAKHILYWSGRYAAPLQDEDADKELAALAKLEDRLSIGSLVFRFPRSFEWNDVDRIYQIVATRLWQIREEHSL